MKHILLGFIFLSLAGFVIEKTKGDKPVASVGKPIEATGLSPLPPQTTNLPFSSTRVTRIIDGDTIVVTKEGSEEKIRLIGVNTPESVDPRRKVECFGKEASDFVSKLLLNKDVRLESDPSQDNRDKYGRLLRFVFLSDETLINREIIAEGYGHEYTYRTPHHYQNDFIYAQQQARKAERGLWAKNACSQTQEPV